MKPKISGTSFGLISIEGSAYHRDVVLRLTEKVKKRKKAALDRSVGNVSHHLVRQDYDLNPDERTASTPSLGQGE